ncbi:MAG: lipolytic protein family [Chthoniobacteraceae bacterium]|nr:lipolytic protein family [Chthoniobacteraceae bacterium]
MTGGFYQSPMFLPRTSLLALLFLVSGVQSGRVHAVETVEVAPPVAHVDRFAKWESEIAAFEIADQAEAPAKGGIVFVGSSSIRLWKTLGHDFPDYPVLNRGFGGSEIVDSTHFADRIIFPYEPRMVVLYAGGNDIHAGRSVDQVFENLKVFLASARAHLPKARIAYISIAGNPSRWAEADKVKALNRRAEEFIQTQHNMKFINVFSEMLGADGLPLPDIFVADKLHMNAEGYKIWTRVIAPLLKPE